MGLYTLTAFSLLIAELRENRIAQIILKPLVALGFLGLALSFGALSSDYGRQIFYGLVACAVGDVLLLPKNNKTFFRLGMLAFAVGHIFYILAAGLILRMDIPDTMFLLVILTGLGVGLGAFKWLKPNLPDDMVWPVGGYTLIITLMLIRALQSDMVGAHFYIVPAAIAFAVSDIFVARDRFVQPNSKNALVITPLYFGAQALFAASVVAVNP